MIGIIGCGWLGFPLAKSFIEKGILVKGTTTSPDKLKILKEEKIIPYWILLSEQQIQGEITDFLKDVRTLIINVPPKLRSKKSENYVAKMKMLHQQIQKSSIKNIVFISSTSVYGAIDGIVTEETRPTPNSESTNKHYTFWWFNKRGSPPRNDAFPTRTCKKWASSRKSHS